MARSSDDEGKGPEAEELAEGQDLVDISSRQCFVIDKIRELGVRIDHVGIFDWKEKTVIMFKICYTDTKEIIQ